MMGKGGIPDRWIPYSPMGSVISGTRFLACKVPLKEALLQTLPENERFGPKDLLKAFPKIGLLIDLTNTTRYYYQQEFTDKNIRYEKIFCPGKVVPPNSIVKRFFEVVDDYLAQEDPDGLIVVHCTHGVNRTGYFICRYMIERLGMSPEEALRNFQQARGHDIERDNYVSDLKNGCKGGNESDMRFVSDNRFRNEKINHGRQQRPYRKRNCYNSERNTDYETSEKMLRRDDEGTSNDYHRSSKWRKKGNKQYEMQGSADRCSYNWRDHGKNPNNHYPEPSEAHGYGNQQGVPPPPHRTPSFSSSNQRHPPVPSYNSARQQGHFANSPQRFRGSPRGGFNPLPKFCYSQHPHDAAPPSRLSVESIANPENTRHAPPRNNTSVFRGHSRGRISNRGRGGSYGRGNNRGRSRNRGGGGRGHQKR